MKNAFLIAATGSGCGKTTITCGLLKVIINRGLIPKSFKCGPDYIDPMFHKSVLNIEAENLDLFFSNEEEVNAIFYREENADVKIVEGVMGLYDGINSSSDEGSSYDLADKLDIPVILIVNAHGMGRSLLALIKGFQAMDTQKRIRGIILNQISPMFYETISTLIEEELKVDVLGYLPKLENCSIESRYLGLKLPNEIEELENDIEIVAKTLEKTVNINRLLDITKIDVNALKSRAADVDRCGQSNRGDQVEGQKNTDSRGEGQKSVGSQGEGQKCICDAHKVRIGVARDEAFCFYYEENLKLLSELGACLIEFSPLHDSVLPENLDGILLGGGYPELYAKKLSSNESMLASIKKAIDSGMPSLAECGGFMYLHDKILVEDKAYLMVGVIEGECSKKEKLVRFGYLTVEEKDSRFVDNGNRCIKGHEFHYYDSTNNGNDAVATKPVTGRTWDEAHIGDNHWWGFAHLYYPSNRSFAKSFVEKCLKWRERYE